MSNLAAIVAEMVLLTGGARALGMPDSKAGLVVTGLIERIEDWANRIEAESAGEVVAWEFQNSETGTMTQLSNDGVNNPGNFLANNPRYEYVGPLFRRPAPPISEALREAAESVGVRLTEAQWQTIRAFMREQGV